MVPGLLEQRDRRSHELLELVDGRVVGNERAIVGGLDTGQRLDCLVTGPACPLCGGVGNCRGPFCEVPRERLGEVELEHDVQACRPGQLEGALEQAGGGSLVAAPERAPAGNRETLGGSFREDVVALSELAPVAGGLLEVVAEDLVQFDEI